MTHADGMIYLFDHRYYTNHEEYCRIIASERPSWEVGEIMTAIQFWWEKQVDEGSNPELDDVLDILMEHYGFQGLDQGERIHEIRYILAAEPEYRIRTYKINGDTFEYLDLYSTRERHCGPGRPEALFKKWLTDEIKEAIVKCRPEE